MINDAQGVLFGAGSRGVEIRLTVYHRTVDYWITCVLLFEYGIEDSVILGNKLYRPFRPHMYETEKEKSNFTLDLVRSLISILVSGIIAMVPICNMRKKRMVTLGDFLEFIMQLTIIIIFLVQLFYING